MNQTVTPCQICGMHADDVHHGRPHDLSQGIGMGGTNFDDAEHFHHIPLCRPCHDGIHNKTIVATATSDGTFAYVIPGGGTITRTDVTDEQLCADWAEGHALGLAGVAMQARAALAFRERYAAFGEGWWKRVAEIIRDTTGLPVSVGTVYDRAALGIALHACGDDALKALATLGLKTMAAIGHHADPEAAAEQAHALRNEGRKQTEVAKIIAGTIHSNETLPCVAHTCKRCGEVWDA